MSKKSSKPAKKVNLPPVPRALGAIEEDYGRLVAQAGQNQYQQFVLVEEQKRINDALRNLNYEAAARKNLDQQELLAKQKEADEKAKPEEAAKQPEQVQ